MITLINNGQLTSPENINHKIIVLQFKITTLINNGQLSIYN